MTEYLPIGFDPGHGAGANRYGPNNYNEGDNVLALGKMLKDAFPGSMLTRENGTNISFSERTRRFVKAKVNTSISLHTNSSPGVLVFYSVDLPEDKAIAEKLANALSKHMGIEKITVRVRLSENPKGNKGGANDNSPLEDYLGMVDRPQDAGIPHVFLVEHGSHWQFAENIDQNRLAVVAAYKEVFGIMEATRIAGNSRYETAVEVSRKGWPNGSQIAYIASGENYPDSTAAGPLAAKEDAPILLTPHDHLHPATEAELKRLNPSHVYVLGGENAISAEVYQSIKNL